MKRFLVSAGCALALGTAATAQTDTAAYDDPREGVDLAQPAPAEFENSYDADDTYDDRAADDDVDSADTRVLTPEDEPYVEDPDDPQGPDAIEPEDLDGPDR